MRRALPLAALLALLLLQEAAALSGLLSLLGRELADEYDLCDSDDFGVDQGVQASCWHQGSLYVGGLFNLAGNSSNQNFARWDGAQWHALSPVGPVLDSTTPVDELDVGVVFALACPPDADYLYVGGYFSMVGAPNVTVNHFARYDVATDSFEALVSTQDEALVGFSAGSTDAAVLDLSCVSADCTDLYVGGFFTQVLEYPASGLVRLDLSDWYSPVVTILGPASYDSDDCLLLGNNTCASVGVDGAVLAVQALPDDAVLFGGLFVSAGDTPLFMAGQWQPGVGPRCIQYSTTEDCDLPILCCQSLSGAVYEIVALSDSRYMLGGDFSNQLFVTDTYGNVNVSVVDDTALVRLDSEGRIVWDPLVRNGTEGWADSGVLGTDGEITSLHCTSFDASDRCTKLSVGGNFTSVFSSSLDASGVVSESVFLEPAFPVVEVDLVWTDSTGACALAGVRAVITDVFSGGSTSTNRSVATVTVSGDAEGSLFVGGVLPDLVNVVRVTPDLSASATLPEAPISVDEASAMYYCVSNVTGGLGASFCCPSGSICPSVGVQVPCPLGWGYYCGPNQLEPDECEEGAYCPTPGSEVACPIHYYCPVASVEPKRCWPSFLCTSPRQFRPERDATVLLASALLLVFFISLNITGTTYRAIRDYLRRRRERLAAARDPRQRKQSNHAQKQLISPVDYRADLGFQNIGVRLRNRKIILNNVSGVLRSGRVTAVMGPSGCGKTTFLSAMSNRIMDGGVVLGKTYINGKRRNLTALQDIMGFVPQDDTMHRDLTVKQTLTMNLRLKGNPDQTSADRAKQVAGLLEALDLTHVRHSLIGDEETRGISGGQRKRVNVAIELTANPLILFLDEPTSGLDSTSSESLIRCLHNFAEAGLTIAMVIHQPRVEVLALIDDVVLLGKGGHQAYGGSIEGAVTYFGKLGYACPPAANPSDFFLDKITDNPTITHDIDSGEELPEPVRLVEYYGKFMGADAPPPVTYDDQGSVPVRRTPSVVLQTITMLHRSFVQQSNSKATFMMDALLLITVGMLVGFLDVADQQYQLASMAIGLTAALSGIRVFGPEQVVTWRETSAGVSTVAYYIGKMLAQIPVLLLAPLFFLSLYYTLKWPLIPLEDYYVTLLCTQCSCAALGYFVSTLVSPKNAQVAGVVSALVSILFAGTTPSAKDLSASTFGQVGMGISYARWCMSAMYIKQTMHAPKPELESYISGLDKLGYADVTWTTQQEDYPGFPELDELETEYNKCLLRLLYLAGVYNFLAFSCLCYVAKKRAHRLSLLHLLVWMSRFFTWLCCCGPSTPAPRRSSAAAHAGGLQAPLLAGDDLPDVVPHSIPATDGGGGGGGYDDDDDEMADMQRQQERLMDARDFIRAQAARVNKRVGRVKGASAAPSDGYAEIPTQESSSPRGVEMEPSHA